ncbi:MAG: hypothetical protein KC468_03935 [Myxococcales bacterium]|nr:hypothetical protein [Myxococcales bacterium]
MTNAQPLPPPPEPVDGKRAADEPWRGRFWLGLRLTAAGGIGGERPSRPTVVSLGGGFDLGWRIRNWIGVGMGFSGQVHDRAKFGVYDDYGVLRDYAYRYGNLFVWDIAYVRVFLFRGRFQPYLEGGGGMTSYYRPEGGYQIGGHVRSGVGFDGWVTPNLTLGLFANYRMLALEQRYSDGSRDYPIGHAIVGGAEMGLHW